MTVQRKILCSAITWLAGVTLLHLWLNTRLLDFGSGPEARTGLRFRVGFLPVT